MPTWTLKNAEEHFFIYAQRTGGEDLLHPLQTQLAANAQVQELITNLHQNLQSTALAASAPFHMALTGTSNGRTAAIEELVHCQEDRGAFNAAVSLLQDSGAFIGQAFDALKLMHQIEAIRDSLQALLRQASIMAWAGFETFAGDLFRLLLVTDAKFLREIDAVQKQTDPWQMNPRRLLAAVEAALQQDAAVSLAPIIDAVDLPTMTLRFVRHFFGVLFPTDPTVTARIGRPLDIPSARRHLLVHRAGVVDQRYVDQSKESLPLGSRLTVTPQDVRDTFRAVVDASVALASAADRRL